jgi:hypothetical protein
MYVQASPLLHLTKFRHFVVLLKHLECTVNFSHVKVFVWQNSKDLAAVYAVGNNFPFWTFVKKTRMSETDVTLAWIEIYWLIAWLIQKGLQSRKDFVVQNCSVKKRLQAGKNWQCRTALWRSRREWHSCLNVLIHPLSYATLYSLLIKAK